MVGGLVGAKIGKEPLHSSRVNCGSVCVCCGVVLVALGTNLSARHYGRYASGAKALVGKYRISESSGRIVRGYLRGGARTHHIIHPSRVVLNDNRAWTPARRCSKCLGRSLSPRAM